MRKTGLCVFLLTVLFSVFAAFPASAEQAVVTGDGVCVRTGPGTAYGIFASLEHGTTVEIVNRSNSDWYLVSWAGNSGYVSSQFLEISEENQADLYTVAPRAEKPGYISGMYVSLRSGPGTSYTILGTYSTGKTLTITGSSGEWIAVRIDQKDGFVYRDYVSEGSPAQSADSSEAAVFQEQPVLETGSTESSPAGQTILLLDESSTPSADDSAQASVPAASETAPSAVPDTFQSAVPALPSESVYSPSLVSVPDDGTQSSSAGTAGAPRLAEITADAVRLRSGPGTTYPILGEYAKGTRLTVTGISDGWYAVTVDRISGYVHSDYVRDLASEETQPNSVSASAQLPASDSAASGLSSYQIRDGYIVGSSVRLRESPSMTAKILAEMNFGSAVKMTGVSGDWTKVIYSGQAGFVSSAFVTEGVFEPAAKVSTAKGNNLGKEIAAYALTYVGTPYRWGGDSPATGFDCSGFVRYVFSQFGYTTSRVANDVTTDGVHVDSSDIQPGDVLCFYSGNNYVGHVGIYIGDNMFVHAANSSVGVVTTSLSTGYYSSRGYETRRII